MLAEGTEQSHIRFTAAQVGVPWSGITVAGAEGSPESRLAYVDLEGNGKVCIEVAGGTLYLDHASFGTTSHPYLALDDSSFLISHCSFPSSTAPFELLHGTGGIKAGGHGIVRDCYFGTTSGYNDIMDFTGGQRRNQSIIQFYNNVFSGATDDILDLDGTDAWIEGNIFLHAHKNGAPDSSAAISGGDAGGETSQITIVRNLFFDCDQAATAKQGNFYSLLNNTIVLMTKAGGLDTADGAINVRDVDPGPPTSFGAGCYLEGNIIRDADQLVRNYDPQRTQVTFVNNLLPLPWEGPGASTRRRSHVQASPAIDRDPLHKLGRRASALGLVQPFARITRGRNRAGRAGPRGRGSTRGDDLQSTARDDGPNGGERVRGLEPKWQCHSRRRLAQRRWVYRLPMAAG